MFESFVTAYHLFRGDRPDRQRADLLAVTEAQDRARKLRTALEGTVIATAIMLFFAPCAWILGYLNITEAAFRLPAASSCSLSR